MKAIERLMTTLSRNASNACVEGEEGTYLYSHLLEQIDSWHGRFDQMKVGPGDVIGLRGDYSLHAVAAQIALMSRGSVAALIPRDGDVSSYMKDSYAKGLVDVHIGGRFEWRAGYGCGTHPLLESLKSTGDGGIVLFTSGSTGRPKAALQGSNRFLSKFNTPTRCYRTMAFLVFDHIAGQDTLFYTLNGGGVLIFPRRRDPAYILRLIESYGVEVLPTSPSFLRLLCLSNLDRQFDLSRLKVITYGSEPMDPTTLADLNSRFPQVQITQKYGATEAGSPRSVSRGRDSLWMKFKSQRMDFKIVEGVLWIRGESVILGYLNAASPVDSEGWYCTGDLVETDGEWLRFQGRLVETINVGGQKVMPGEVERCILELGFVRNVVVSGLPNALLGQVVAARVSLAENHIDAKQAIRKIWKHCRQRLAPCFAPVKIEIISDEMTTERQKLIRIPQSDK